ncbi:MAG TPA: hypothetical protein VF169_14980 [Albitalea sp.]|uniref:hypothetical protein n=1 Tax=Piscinibacter sp. TaxID=1903157 RepID=UPI002ED4190E
MSARFGLAALLHAKSPRNFLSITTGQQHVMGELNGLLPEPRDDLALKLVELEASGVNQKQEALKLF